MLLYCYMIIVSCYHIIIWFYYVIILLYYYISILLYYHIQSASRSPPGQVSCRYGSLLLLWLLLVSCFFEQCCNQSWDFVWMPLLEFCTILELFFITSGYLLEALFPPWAHFWSTLVALIGSRNRLGRQRGHTRRQSGIAGYKVIDLDTIWRSFCYIFNFFLKQTGV